MAGDAEDQAVCDENAILPAESDNEVVQPVFKSTAKHHSVYLVILLYNFTISLGSPTVMALIYNKACVAKYNDISRCTNTTFTRDHKDLQTIAASWNTYTTLARLVPAILSNLLLSSYCDSVGHRLPMMLPAIGSFMAFIWLAVLATPQLMYWPMGLLMIYPVLDSFLGYSPMVVMSSFSYVTLTSSDKNRPLYLALAEGTSVIGTVIGSAINGPVIDHLGVAAMTYIGLGASVLVVLTVMFLVPEIKKPGAENFSWSETFKFKHSLDIFICVYKSRPQNRRLIFHLGATVVLLVAICNSGYSSINFLYLVKEEGLSMSFLSIYSSVTAAVSFFLVVVALNLLKFLQLNGMHVALFASLSAFVGYLIMSFTYRIYLIWIGGILLYGMSVMYVIVLNRMSKVVDRNEMGKIFLYTALLQIVALSVTGLIFNGLYAATLSFWPQSYVALCALLVIVMMACISLIHILKIKHNLQ